MAKLEDANASASTAPGWIVIARHGEPAMDRSVRLSCEEYVQWWRGYDEAGLKPGQSPPPQLLEEAANADTLMSSVLPRAMETADAVAGGRAVVRDPVFVEAAMPPPALPIRTGPRRWGVLARISWWFGFAGEHEPRAKAQARAEAAAATLVARAMRGENVLVCAHGWFNRMMRPVLLRWGWRCVYDGGDGYWSHRKYVRRR
jgi:broad specificity phosphatase PhoE